MGLMKKKMEAALEATTSFLETMGLTISAEKSCCMTFNRGRRRAVTVEIDDTTIPSVRKHRFLGVTMGDKLSWTPQANVIKESTATPQGTLKRLQGTDWGCSPKALLALDRALVVSRMLYSLRYAFPPPSKQLQLEAAHRTGLRTALGLPQRAPSGLACGEAGSMPLRLTATERLLRQFDRLRKTETEREIVSRIHSQKKSRIKIMDTGTY
ncbi:uncharacterized protein LOC135392231 [Ornithodoros turicata]|uniref:uncharacterized protein LOC135392231 n=1 Tax=Ornithodoros turicata TaxID=34597 RepID=UPI0031397429